MRDALKDHGLIYTSFKYGEFEGWIGDRYFTYFTWKSFRDMIAGIGGLQIEEIWLTPDSRPERADQQWLNCTLSKC